ELREEEDEEAVVAKAIGGSGAAPEIDEVGDFLEDEEADAERQDDVEMRHCVSGEAEKIGKEEIDVLEESQCREIERDAEIEADARGVSPRQSPIEERETDQERHEAGIPPTVVDQRRGDEETCSRAAIVGEGIVKAERDRQEDENEDVGAEKHRAGMIVPMAA